MRAMVELLALQLALCSAADLGVEGLRPGERAALLAGTRGSVDPAAEPWCAGRVLDGATGLPLSGVRVEVWTEDDLEPRRLTQECESDAGGCFALRDPGPHGTKLVLSREGYTSLGGALPCEELVLLPRAAPLELRFVDVHGAPVEGVRVRTCQTCAHDAPASTGASDASGRVRLEDLPRPDPVELYVEHEGYASRHLSSVEELRPSSSCPDAGDVVLTRIAPVRLRVLDAEGLPVANRRVLSGGPPELVRGRTDGDGALTLATRYAESRELSLVLAGGEGTWLGGGLPPSGGELWTVRPLPEPPGEAGARLVVTVEGEAAGTVRVVHEDGWLAYGAGEHRLPPGEVRVELGGDFSGVRPDARALWLEAGESREVALAARPEPTLAVRLPHAGAWRVVVEAGGDSLAVETAEPELRLPVPAGRPLVCVLEGPRGELRRVACPPLQAPARLDPGPDTVLRAPHEDPVARGAELVVTLADEAPGAVFGAVVGGAGRLAESAESGRFRVPPGAACVAWAGAPGRVTRYVQETTPARAGEVRSCLLELPLRAELVVRGPLVALEAGHHRAAAGEGEARLSGLAPGPLVARALFADGSVVELRLELAPGESRVLALR